MTSLYLILSISGAAIFVHDVCKLLFFPSRGHNILRAIILIRVASAIMLTYSCAICIATGKDFELEIYQAITMLMATQAIIGPWLWYIGIRVSDFLAGNILALRGNKTEVSK